MKCQNLIDFSERKVYATKKKENQETGGDTDEAGAKTKKPIIFYYVIALIVILLLNLLLFPRLLEPKVTEVDYGKFLQMVDNNEISEVQIQSNEIIFSDKSSPANYYKTGVMNDYKLVDRLYEAGITEFGTPIIEQMSPLMEFLLTWVIPIVVMVALGQWLMKRMTSKMMGGMGNAMSFGKSNAKVYVQSETGIKFADVAGEMRQKKFYRRLLTSCIIQKNMKKLVQKCRKEHCLSALQEPVKRCLQRQ